MSSSLLLQQYSAYFVHLIWIVFDNEFLKIFLEYSYAFVSHNFLYKGEISEVYD